jgi:DNA-binding transcriptional ArsR family regulator
VPRYLLSQSSLDRTLAALSEPTRRRLLERVGRGARRASDVGRGLGVSRPAISKHLGVLRRAGLVTVDERGRERIYRLAPAPHGLRAARAYIERASGFWDRALDAFKAFAEQENDR